MTKEYIIYCDESEERGKHFSNFYGGALIRSDHIEEVRRIIREKKRELNFHNEVKWTKVTLNYRDKYIDLMDCFFDLVRDDFVKIRIMFTQNTHVPLNLSRKHVEEKYFILYYHFIKHAFGLKYSPLIPGGVQIRVYPDKMPDTKEQIAKFKSFLASLSKSTDFRRKGLVIKNENVAEIISHKHDVLQCLDIVLGSIHFRLNDKHKEKPRGKAHRGKRTRAKEAVYKHINKRIREIYPHFNIGISTGHQGEISNRWNHSYRHWRFIPTDVAINPGSKLKERVAP